MNGKNFGIKKKIVVLLYVLLCTPLLHYFWFEFSYREIGKRKIQELTLELSDTEINALDTFHQIADWELNNLNPTYRSIYFYPFFPFFVIRKIPPEATFTILVKHGACQEFSTLFSAFLDEIGIESRVVSNIGEDHAWNEIFINGSWVHFDGSLNNSSKRYNNPEHYERSVSNGGWEKNISCIYYTDVNGTKHEITQKYTDTGTLEIIVYENGAPLKNAIVTVYSKFLMQDERFKDQYKKPRYSIVKNTNSQGISIFELGENDYRIKVTRKNWIKRSKVIDISVKENMLRSIKIEF